MVECPIFWGGLGALNLHVYLGRLRLPLDNSNICSSGGTDHRIWFHDSIDLLDVRVEQQPSTGLDDV